MRTETRRIAEPNRPRGQPVGGAVDVDSFNLNSIPVPKSSRRVSSLEVSGFPCSISLAARTAQTNGAMAVPR